MDSSLEVRVNLTADMSLGEALALEAALDAYGTASLQPLRRAMQIQLAAAAQALLMSDDRGIRCS